MNIARIGKTTLLLLSFGAVFSACESNTQTKQGVDQDQAEVTAINPEFIEFRKVALEKIEKNTQRINELKARISESGGEAPLDNLRARRIETLEAKNTDLRLQLLTYEKAPGDWEKFKKEFNHDLESFEEAFKDLGSNDVTN